jgi:hypothetical protein
VTLLLPLQRLCKVERNLEDRNKKALQRDKKLPGAFILAPSRNLFSLHPPEG